MNDSNDSRLAFLVGGWTNPVEKYAEPQIGSFGPGSGENKSYSI